MTLAEAGKAMMRLRDTVEFTDTLALQSRAVALAGAREGAAVQVPAEAAVMAVPLPQHAQAVQPRV